MAVMLAFKLAELGLLIRREDLEERRLGFGVSRSDLGSQGADGAGGLIDRRGVVALHGVFQVLMSVFKLA
jgi:hypothetical protein